ncbi:Mob1/phocein [Trichoderma austrokoningii]
MSLAPSSPRLPSPPPPAEIQIGPNSPSGGSAATLATTEMEQSHIDASSSRRIHPGTKSADMAVGPPLVPLSELDSPFQLQEHLAALHYHSTVSGTQPLTRESALQLAQPPNGIDRTLWLYELCRFLISQCNSLIVGFLFDSPPCSANTCPEMRASEWQFLCAVHESPKSCCAIDYCCHTLDWAANVVSDQKIFPSRFVVVNDVHSKNVSVKSLVNVFRRLHRIFAHAWFQHRSVFWAVEGQTGLYVFFKTVCDLYDLLPAENYKLPPEAEGLDAHPDFDVNSSRGAQPPPQILKASASQTGANEGGDDDGPHGSINRTNTRRHIRSSPSTGSSVTTVMEAEEEDTNGVSRRLRSMHLAGPDLVEEEDSESAEVPVMVEQSVIIAGPPPPLLFSLSSEPGQDDETGTTVFDLSDASQPTSGVSESVVEITDDDVTSVIDTSDGQIVEEAATAETPIEEQTSGEIPILSEEPPHTSEAPAETANEEEKPTTPEETGTKGEAVSEPPATEGDATDAAKEENAQHEET